MFLEKLPSAIFSRHIECYWQLNLAPNNQGPLDNLPPQGTFDIIFLPHSISMHQFDGKAYQEHYLAPGCWLIGQQMRNYSWQSKMPLNLFGIRIKPFGLFSYQQIYAADFHNSQVNLSDICHLSTQQIDDYIERIYQVNSLNEQVIYAEQLVQQLFNGQFEVPQQVRAMSNVIMDHRGSIQLNQLCTEFNISKVTMREQFLQHIGLLPKELCKIWRLNNVLLLQQQAKSNMTDLALQAGYFDQAHFTKEFKTVFNLTPAKFFKQQQSLSSITQINQRLNNGYPPIYPALKSS